MKKALLFIIVLVAFCACEKEKVNPYSVYNKEYISPAHHEYEDEYYGKVTQYDIEGFDAKYHRLHRNISVDTLGNIVGSLEEIYEIDGVQRYNTYQQEGQLVVTCYYASTEKDTIISYGDSIKIRDEYYHFYRNLE